MRSPKKRVYRMRQRAEHVDRTRQSIVDAAVGLHRTVGLGAPVSQIAEAAGVTRATYYRHFPTTVDLFSACSADWEAGQDLPDPERWSGGDPAQAVRVALADVFRHYAEAKDMRANVSRDFHLLPDALQRRVLGEQAEMLEAFLGLLGPARRRRLVRQVAAHVLDFDTWHSLVAEQGVSNRDAVELMASLVERAAVAPRGGGRT